MILDGSYTLVIYTVIIHCQYVHKGHAPTKQVILACNTELGDGRSFVTVLF